MLAVPERRLGDGVLERAPAVKAIRSSLNELGRYVILHLLGTGNPISIALYSAMGADSFDGLEWCQTVVDHESGLLYHLSQADFFAGQTAWGDDQKLSFQARTLAHNLEFFSDWMRRMRDAVSQDRLAEFCRSNLPLRAYRHVADVAGWSQS
jgi:queuine/archaeosine tRNA-ribosyltransferase